MPFHSVLHDQGRASAWRCFLIVFAWFVFFAPNYLGHPDNYIPANPLVTPAHIVPEWYFLPFYAILRAIPDKLLACIAMFGSISCCSSCRGSTPRGCARRNFRPLYRRFFWIFVIVCVVLGWLGAQAGRGRLCHRRAHPHRSITSCTS